MDDTTVVPGAKLVSSTVKDIKTRLYHDRVHKDYTAHGIATRFLVNASIYNLIDVITSNWPDNL